MIISVSCFKNHRHKRLSDSHIPMISNIWNMQFIVGLLKSISTKFWRGTKKGPCSYALFPTFGLIAGFLLVYFFYCFSGFFSSFRAEFIIRQGRHMSIGILPQGVPVCSAIQQLIEHTQHSYVNHWATVMQIRCWLLMG